MAVASLNCDLVAIDQTFARVVEVSVAESTRHSNRGDRTESLHRIEHRCVREAGNVSHPTQLTAARLMAAGQTSTRASGPDAAGGETQTWVAPIAHLEGTVGQITEGIPQRHLASSPARHCFQADSMQLLRIIGAAVERSAPEVLEKEITLGPELLEIESSENVGNGL